MKKSASTVGSGSGLAKTAFLRRRWPLLVALGVVAGLVFWWWQPRDFSNDPQLVEIRELQERVQSRFSTNGGPATLAEAKDYNGAAAILNDMISQPHQPRAAGQIRRIPAGGLSATGAVGVARRLAVSHWPDRSKSDSVKLSFIRPVVTRPFAARQALRATACLSSIGSVPRIFCLPSSRLPLLRHG
ncbi:MAG: hypothetical protein EBU59_02500 [Planctomycetia bacterium]|nr:hypothetical protein [Planctomycetia bacterium]